MSKTPYPYDRRRKRSREFASTIDGTPPVESIAPIT